MFRLGAWSCNEPVDSTAISRDFVSSKRGLLGTPEFRKLDPKSPSTPVVKKVSSMKKNTNKHRQLWSNVLVIEFIHLAVHVAVNATSKTTNKQIRCLLIFTKLHVPFILYLNEYVSILMKVFNDSQAICQTKKQGMCFYERALYKDDIRAH